MSDKIKYSSKKFDVINRKGRTGLFYKKMTVAVLPYIVDDGMLSKLGILHEWNPFRQENYSYSIITGTVDPEDKDFLQAAKRELIEEGGIDIQDNEKWVFLGSLNNSKGSDEAYHVFAVDASGIDQSKPEGDGSKTENLSEFSFMDTGNAITLSDETLLLASFTRLFDFFYHKTE